MNIGMQIPEFETHSNIEGRKIQTRFEPKDLGF